MPTIGKKFGKFVIVIPCKHRLVAEEVACLFHLVLIFYRGASQDHKRLMQVHFIDMQCLQLLARVCNFCRISIGDCEQRKVYNLIAVNLFKAVLND